MSHAPSQDLKNHPRYVPLFHFVAGPILLINLIYTIVITVRYPILDNIVGLLVAFALLVLFLSARRFATTVQDRVIRLEERLRLQALAPAEWHAQIYRLTEDQLIGLRFAADNEVVELAKQALEGNLNRKQIKERIKSWRADNWRV